MNNALELGVGSYRESVDLQWENWVSVKRRIDKGFSSDDMPYSQGHLAAKRAGSIAPKDDLQTLEDGYAERPMTLSQILSEIEQSANSPLLQVRRAILTLEFMEIPVREHPRVSKALIQFIANVRIGAHEERLIIACSAVRKFIGMLPVKKLEEVASLLKPRVVPLAIEAEVATMLFRKLEANPATRLAKDSDLARQLMAILTEYSGEYVFPKDKKYHVVVINAVAVLIASQSSLADNVIERIRQPHLGWARNLVIRKLQDLKTKWQTKDESVTSIHSIDGSLQKLASKSA